MSTSTPQVSPWSAASADRADEYSIPDGSKKDRLFGVSPTFRRPDRMKDCLNRVARQTRLLDHLVVVDNSPTTESRKFVEEYSRSALTTTTYVASPENLGSCGGYRRGMEVILDGAGDDDWIVIFDDDTPPPSDHTFEEIERFAQQMRQIDPLTGAVGFVGGRFDWKRGGIKRVADQELHGPVPVDFVGAGHFPLYSVRAIRAAGPFSDQLFFGLSEVEFGLRLRKAGYSIYAHGDRWMKGRQTKGRMGLKGTPSLRLPQLNWRRYYSLRNSIYILRSHNKTATAVRVTVTKGLLKPILNFGLDPRGASRHLVLNLRACRDGWTGRMGRTIEPDGLARP